MPHPGRRSAIYGEAVTADGAGLPVTIDSNVSLIDKAGISPDVLDEAIRGFVKIIDDGTAMLSNTGDTIARLMTHLEKELNRQITQLEAEYANGHGANGEVVRGLSPQLAESLKMANSVTVILDRVHKMMSNAVKAQDQAVRLRTFIATGDEAVTGLEGQSENALRRLINATLAGEMVPVEQRR